MSVLCLPTDIHSTSQKWISNGQPFDVHVQNNQLWSKMDIYKISCVYWVSQKLRKIRKMCASEKIRSVENGRLFVRKCAIVLNMCAKLDYYANNWKFKFLQLWGNRQLCPLETIAVFSRWEVCKTLAKLWPNFKTNISPKGQIYWIHEIPEFRLDWQYWPGILWITDGEIEVEEPVGARPRRMSEIKQNKQTLPIPPASSFFIFSPNNR